MWFCRRRSTSITAEREPRYSAPVEYPGCEGMGVGGRIWCIGVHIACVTSGGSWSKRIMVNREARLSFGESTCSGKSRDV